MPRVVISDHAGFEMERRQIAEDAVRLVALAPGASGILWKRAGDSPVADR